MPWVTRKNRENSATVYRNVVRKQNACQVFGSEFYRNGGDVQRGQPVRLHEEARGILGLRIPEEYLDIFEWDL